MTWNKFNAFMADVANGVHNLGADTLKIALTNTAPTAADALLADITEISAAGGYAAATATINSSAQTGGTYALGHDAVTFTATGAAFDEFRYAVLYNDTATDKPLVVWRDYGVAYVLPDGQPFTFSAGDFLTLA